MIRTLLLLGSIGTLGGATTVDAANPTTSLVVAALLLMLSAFFSGSETALFSLQQMDRQTLRERGVNLTVDRLLTNPRSTLASLLIGNESVNVLLSTVTAGLLLALAPDLPWLNLVVLTPMLIIFGEVMPKSLTFRFNRQVAPVVAPIVALIARVVTPVRLVLMRLAEATLVLTGGSTAPRRAAVREAHLRALVERGHQAGTIRPMEKEVITRVFEFGDLTVSRLMTPRPDMFTLDVATPWSELLAAVREEGLSRIPMWSTSPDNIAGILLVKDLLPLLAEHGNPSPRRIQRLLRRPHFVPATKRAGDLLAEFRLKKFHQSLVVDEHGVVVGLVTLDDLLAELVGDVLDDTEESDADIIPVSEGVFRVKGHLDVDDFELRFGHELPEGDYNTLGGFLMTQLGEVPEAGAELIYDGIRFTVVQVDTNRVVEVRVQLRRAGESVG